jgi:UDP-N-acetylglucosamine 2-epimerase (non-hydrolysing)
LSPMEHMIRKHRPDTIIAQGDTTTVFVTALTSFYLGIPFAHVEAGLRTGNLRAPFPEEFNRVTASRVAHWHFCPTMRAVTTLRANGIDSSRVFLTGNTGIDSLRLTLERTAAYLVDGRCPRRILLTVHRRENQGCRMKAICRAVREIVDEFKDVAFVVPVHPNPMVRCTLEQLLGGHERILLLPPIPYQRFVSEMAQCYLILTDSGGIQEEAPYLKKPVLVLRDVTERPEAIDLGVSRLVGTESASVIDAVRELLIDSTTYSRMASGGSPYGDGYAAQRIASALGSWKAQRYARSWNNCLSFRILMHAIISFARSIRQIFSLDRSKLLTGRDPLDEELRTDGIEIIAPHRGNRLTNPPTQDRRRVSRFIRRWPSAYLPG